MFPKSKDEMSDLFRLFRQNFNLEDNVAGDLPRYLSAKGLCGGISTELRQILMK